MNLIKNPTTLAQRIVNTVCNDIYGRSGGDHFFDSCDQDILDEMGETLTEKVQLELEKGPR